MLPAIPVILAALAIGGAVVVVAFWDEIVDWLNDFIPKVEKAFRDIAHGAQVLGEKINSKIVEIKHKLFFKENNKWMEKSTIRQIDESAVPPHIREKIMKQSKAADLTGELAPMLLS